MLPLSQQQQQQQQSLHRRRAMQRHAQQQQQQHLAYNPQPQQDWGDPLTPQMPGQRQQQMLAAGMQPPQQQRHLLGAVDRDRLLLAQRQQQQQQQQMLLAPNVPSQQQSQPRYFPSYEQFMAQVQQQRLAAGLLPPQHQNQQQQQQAHRQNFNAQDQYHPRSLPLNPQPQQPQPPPRKPTPLEPWQRALLTCSYNNQPLDLNSRSATRTLKFVFPPSNRSAAPIALFSTPNPAAACMHIKDWLLSSFNKQEFFAPGVVRMEDLQLHGFAKGKAGWLLVGKDVCFLDSDVAKPVTVLAVLVPGDQKVRWFYTTLLPIASLLQRLGTQHHLLQLRKVLKTGTENHRKFVTYIEHSFLSAIYPPQSPDFINAETTTNCCPSILNPETALARLEGNEFLHFAAEKDCGSEAGWDLSDDRYLDHLHPAERDLASRVHLRCAEYLLVKRNFFRSFFEEIYRTDKKIEGLDTSTTAATMGRTAATADSHNNDTPTDTPQRNRNRSGSRASTPQSQAPTTPARRGGRRPRVRTECAHRVWLETEYEWRATRAKILVIGWKELGFLEEGRFLEWMRAGGMLEGEFGEEDEGEEEGEAGRE